MRHLKKGRKFGRRTDQRKAFLKSLIRALVLKRRITTTEARAKELRPAAEKLVTKAKTGTLAARRDVSAATSPEIARILFGEIAAQYKGRNGGYTRIMKLGARRSDAAKMAIIEFVESE